MVIIGGVLMGKEANNIGKLIKMIRDYDQLDEKAYHDAHLLLKIYSDVVWGMSERYDDIICECQESYGDSSLDVLDVMTEFGSNVKAKLLQEQLQNIETSKIIIDMVNRATMKLRTYPRKGEQYYNILTNTYFVRKKHTEQELLEILNMSRTTYYRQKKKAICLFGVVLWGYIIPDIIKDFEDELVAN